MRRHCRPWTWPAYRQLLLRSSAPILAGPFRGELGFEALYWLPFLARLRQEGIAPDRLIPIGRAGSAVWYETPQGLELYAMRAPRDLRIENMEQRMRWGLLKQTHVSPWDRQVLRDAAETLHLKRYWTLHPAWMYQLLTPVWNEAAGLQTLDRVLRFTELAPPPLPDGITLPAQFIAVKFYERHTLPRTPTILAFVEHTIRQIAKTHPVIVLDWDQHADDHADFVPPEIPNVTRLSTLLPHILPETILAVQSAVLARSLGFVGTYGGFAHLALRFRRPVISFYWEFEAVVPAHRTVSQHLALKMGVPFHCLRILDLPILQEVLPIMQFQHHAAPESQLVTV